MANEGQAIALNEEQHKQFINYLATTRYAARDTLAYLFTIRAGMRIGSVAGLNISDVLDTDGTPKEVVVLRKDITKGQKTLTAYIAHPELQEALSTYLKVRPKYKSEALLLSQKGGGFSPHGLSEIICRHYKLAKLDGASSHSGRRTCITNWIKAGGDIVAVSKLAGHSSIITTQRYVHHNQEELLKLVSLES